MLLEAPSAFALQLERFSFCEGPLPQWQSAHKHSNATVRRALKQQSSFLSSTPSCEGSIGQQCASSCLHSGSKKREPSAHSN